MNKIKIVSRSSNLALIQVDELMSRSSVEYEAIPIDSYGDKNKDISLLDNTVKDIFTKEIDEAIINGIGDIAIHSAKDLPYPLNPDIEIIALIPPFDQTDSLVSFNNLKLNELPREAKIGTSSKERKRQILENRPDLKIVSIRGTIEERLGQVDSGYVDALIVATCALKRLGLDNRISEVLDFNTHPLQGFLAVTSKRNNLNIRNIFFNQDILKSYGKVSLVGFGPGNPDLLTIKAHKILELADVIFYDALIPEGFLQVYAGEKVFVGKRKRKHSYSQGAICELMYKAAINGKKVVRLKGGDPYIFGRGGEEYDYLKSRLIEVESVPGITAAQGAAASLNVPLTRRGISRELCLYTGHQGDLESKTKTNVFYMGGTKLEEIQKKLIESGEDRKSSVLLIERATTPEEFVIKTTIEFMHEQSPELPVIIITGGVTKDYQPVKVILNTGLRNKSYGLKGQIIHRPLISIEKMDFKVDLKKFDSVLFTSITAVNHFCQNLDLKNKKIISIGKGTSERLKKIGYNVDYTASEPDSDTLRGEIESMNWGRIIYPCSLKSENELHNIENVTSLNIYTVKSLTLKDTDKIALERVEGILFTSPSTVDSFIDNYGDIPEVDIFCFGKFTKSRLKSYKKGLNVQKISL